MSIIFVACILTTTSPIFVTIDEVIKLNLYFIRPSPVIREEIIEAIEELPHFDENNYIDYNMDEMERDMLKGLDLVSTFLIQYIIIIIIDFLSELRIHNKSN